MASHIVRDGRHPAAAYGLRVGDRRRRPDSGVLGPAAGPLGAVAGTFARTGVGWVAGTPDTGSIDLRMEFHDREPADDTDTWDDVLAAPYLSRNGLVRQDLDGLPAEVLHLDGPGLYRVEIAATGSRWRLRFRPDDGTSEPPRRIRRSTPATNSYRLGCDIYSVLAWTPAREATITGVADRLLCTPADVRNSVERIARTDPATGLRLRDDTTIVLDVHCPADPLTGPPPRHGWIDARGRLHLWQGTRPRPVERYGDPCPHGFVDLWHEAPFEGHRAPHGLLLFHHGGDCSELLLRRDDATTVAIGYPQNRPHLHGERTLVYQEDGRWVAFDLVDARPVEPPSEIGTETAPRIGFYADPPALILDDPRRIIRLPTGSRAERAMREDEEHVLVPADARAGAYRVHLPSGRIEIAGECGTQEPPCDCGTGIQPPVIIEPAHR